MRIHMQLLLTAVLWWCPRCCSFHTRYSSTLFVWLSWRITLGRMQTLCIFTFLVNSVDDNIGIVAIYIPFFQNILFEFYKSGCKILSVKLNLRISDLNLNIAYNIDRNISTNNNDIVSKYSQNTQLVWGGNLYLKISKERPTLPDHDAEPFVWLPRLKTILPPRVL